MNKHLQQKRKSVIRRFAAACLFSMAFILQFNAQVSYSFTPCSATGSIGPSQGMVNTAYQPTNLNGLVTVSSLTQGLQFWTVPTSGAYKIEAFGGQGGNSMTYSGGLGAKISGEFNFTAGTVLGIVVGQAGIPGSATGGGGGGGGGSGVMQGTTLLIVGGGGGGAGTGANGLGGTATTSGGATTSNAFLGGTNGAGGQASASNGGGCGGGGFLGAGTKPAGGTSNTPGVGGFAAIGGQLSTNCGGYGGPGGFGVGGGGGGESAHGGSGGGGGYSGGGGGEWQNSGWCSTALGNGSGGGGSYNTGTNPVNTAAANAGQGMVVITRMCNVDLQASKNPLCNGESITLTTNAASNIVWSHSGSNASQVNVSPTANTTYTVTGQAISGCTTSVVLTVSVNPLPDLKAIVSPSVMCVGKDATITASGAITYTWTTLSLNGPVATVNPPATTGYNVSGTNQFGCVNSAVINVNVNTNQLGISSNTSVCQGGSVQLNLSNALTYTWSTGNSFATTVVSPITNTTYMASGTDIYNCVISNMVAVTVNQRPNVIANTNKGSVCKGESVTLTAGGATTYTWNNNLGAAASVNVTLPAETVYNYVVTGADANGCTNTANVQVTANRCTGIKENESGTAWVSVYPNPSSGLFTIALQHATSAVSIEITDLSGRVVLKDKIESAQAQINLQHYSAGVYYATILSNGQKEVIKLIKD